MFFTKFWWHPDYDKNLKKSHVEYPNLAILKLDKKVEMNNQRRRNVECQQDQHEVYSG